MARLRQAGVGRGELVGLAVAPGTAVGLATGAGAWALPAAPGNRVGDPGEGTGGGPGAGAGGALSAGAGSGPGRGVGDRLGRGVGGGLGGDLAGQLALVDRELRPRWVVWSGETAATLVAASVRLATAWDITAVQRLLAGGWRADPGRAWAHLEPGLPPLASGPPDLFQPGDGGDPDEPVGPSGHLRPEWADGGWRASPERVARWAELARSVAVRQQQALARLDGRPMALATAHSESAAELLCAELSADGLPMSRAVAEQVLAGFIGPRPRDEAEAVRNRAARDAAVLRLAPDGTRADLRSPAQVKTLLTAIGVDVPDTRAWRLKALQDTHPLVAALLEWRKAERIATTYGYGWLDQHLGPDDRLRGAWTGSDGAAGRMTASGGLHNMPAAMRQAVVAGDGHVFVRADLGQIEPRVLAAVAGDRALAAATRADDLYAPVAAQLGVDRPTAKVAVLGAMYGQTTGHGAQALRRLKRAYPVAMGYLEEGDRAGQDRRDVRTYGGRLIALSRAGGGAGGDSPARAAARGRYGRNALIQGAAAELFKMWAVTVRARAAALDARIVLCLHDELLVHAPAGHGPAVAALVDDCLQEAARRWAPDASVRFIADTSVVERWADAKGGGSPPLASDLD
ncbi:MAG: DNA polymerase I [Actinobacteria bacterium]|nr:DNA polymerase I [Actinomycetota bacterium]